MNQILAARLRNRWIVTLTPSTRHLLDGVAVPFSQNRGHPTYWLICAQAAAAVAATKGVVGTVPQNVREDLVGRQFGADVLAAKEPRLLDDDDGLDFLDLTDEELEAFAKELAGV